MRHRFREQQSIRLSFLTPRHHLQGQPYGRVYNFSAGPAMLPLDVLEQCQADLVNYKVRDDSRNRKLRNSTYLFSQQNTQLSEPETKRVSFVCATTSTSMCDVVQGSGMSVMEMSHRGKEYMGIAAEAQTDLRELLKIPENYKVLFMQACSLPLHLVVASSQRWLMPSLKRGRQGNGLDLNVTTCLAIPCDEVMMCAFRMTCAGQYSLMHMPPDIGHT
jgi:hypothetical protein